MGRSALLHTVIQTTILVSIATQLYSAAAAADATCSCSSSSSSSALQCHGVTPALQQQLVEQLGSCTATSLQLHQQLLRQQHHTPVVLAVLDSSSMWQLLVCAVLLGLCLLCFAQARASRRKCAALQHALQQQVTLARALHSSRGHLQKQLYQHQQRNAAWAASLQHMQWLVVERATALAAQEALLSKALGVPSMLEGAADAAIPADGQLVPAAADRTESTCVPAAADEVALHTSILQEQGGAGGIASTATAAAAAVAAAAAAAAAAASSSDSSSKDDVSVIQQGLDMLHAYLHACSKAKLAGLEQLQLFVQQLEQDVQHSLQEMQQQEQQQQQLAGLPEEGGVDDLLCEGEAQQQQHQQQQQQPHGVSGAADSWQESSKARLQDSPFMRERLATTVTAKQQPAGGSAPAHSNEDVIRKRLFFSTTTRTGATAAAAAVAGGDGCDAGTGRMADQDSAVLATPVLTCSSAKQSQQGFVARLLLRCFQPSSNSPRCKE